MSYRLQLTQFWDQCCSFSKLPRQNTRFSWPFQLTPYCRLMAVPSNSLLQKNGHSILLLNAEWWLFNLKTKWGVTILPNRSAPRCSAIQSRSRRTLHPCHLCRQCRSLRTVPSSARNRSPIWNETDKQVERHNNDGQIWRQFSQQTWVSEHNLWT